VFWSGTSAAAGAVFLWFAFSYRGRKAERHAAKVPEVPGEQT
jgi:hypothetical protein